MSYGRTKEQFYESCLRNRKLAADPENLKCICPDTLCEWHGKCKECVALHRVKKTHLPACLHGLIEDSVNDLLKAIELTATKLEITSPEYRHYVLERDKAIKDE